MGRLRRSTISSTSTTPPRSSMRRSLPIIQQQIWELIQQAQLQADLDLRAMLARDHGDHKHEWDDELTPEGVPVTLAEMSGNDVAHLIEDIDGYLCELGTAQIRDGLHALGAMPALPDTLRALTRLPNGAVPGLQAALARAFGLDLQSLLAAPGARFDAPPRSRRRHRASRHARRDRTARSPGARSVRRSRGRGLRRTLGRSARESPARDARTPPLQDCLRFACRTLVPALELVTDEMDHVLDALAGRYVPPGPAGAPTRGMAHILPTGRNFYAVDPRARSVAGGVAGRRAARARGARAPSRGRGPLSRDDRARRLGHVPDADARRRRRGGAGAAGRGACVGSAVPARFRISR